MARKYRKTLPKPAFFRYNKGNIPLFFMKKKVIIAISVLVFIIAVTAVGQRYGYWDLKKLKGSIILPFLEINCGNQTTEAACGQDASGTESVPTVDPTFIHPLGPAPIKPSDFYVLPH